MLFNKKIEPSCSYCVHGSQINERQIACVKKGVIPAGSHCRKFQYDPLKRSPSRPVLLKTEGFTEEDFIL